VIQPSQSVQNVLEDKQWIQPHPSKSAKGQPVLPWQGGKKLSGLHVVLMGNLVV
jgi:hypothetical protein